MQWLTSADDFYYLITIWKYIEEVWFGYSISPSSLPISPDAITRLASRVVTVHSDFSLF